MYKKNIGNSPETIISKVNFFRGKVENSSLLSPNSLLLWVSKGVTIMKSIGPKDGGELTSSKIHRHRIRKRMQDAAG